MTHSNDGASSPMAPVQQRRASGRSMPFKIGVGCLGVIVLGCLFFAGVLAIASVAVRSSDAYQLALAAAQREPSVTTALGAPVRAGWLTTGHVNVAGPNGEATLEIPISGPRGSGTIAVRASKSAGKWSFSRLDVSVSGHAAPLDLLAPAAP